MSVVVVCSPILFFSCASAPDQGAPYEGDPSPAPATVAPDTREPRRLDAGQADSPVCTALAAGCVCEVEGEQVRCGTSHDVIGDYVRCGPLYTTCTGGVWSECVGDRFVTGN
jgi:hypothetical protein